MTKDQKLIIETLAKGLERIAIILERIYNADVPNAPLTANEMHPDIDDTPPENWEEGTVTDAVKKPIEEPGIPVVSLKEAQAALTDYISVHGADEILKAFASVKAEKLSDLNTGQRSKLVNNIQAQM